MIIVERPVTIAIVTFNSAQQIADCVRMFVDRGPRVRVRVRDNGSTDSTPAILRRLAAEGQVDDLVLAPDDPGFAVAANDLIGRAGDDDVLLVDPDSRISLEAVEVLCDAIAQDPRLGLVGPVIRGGDHIRVMSAGRQPRLWPMLTHYTGLSRVLPGVALLQGRHLFLKQHSRRDQLVEWTSGCCLLIPRSTIERVGLLSERWFMYVEDTEYCKRVSDAGLRIKVLAAACAFHQVGGSGAPPESLVATTDSVGDPVIDVSDMWGRNLYDYYVHEFHPGSVTRLAWRLTFTAGNGVRALAYRKTPGGRVKSDHLMKNALAVWR